VAFHRSGIQTLSSLGVRAAILGDDAVGEALVHRYIDPLHALGGMRDGMLDTIEQYFRCQSRLEPAARALHVHVNTVKYRLARFEELTGATLRDPEVLVEAWWAVQRSRLP
jgi:DNA-binding PucR family transcriptional regulator